MRIHGLSYADMASVQVNRSAWLPLNNDTVVVAEPGHSYGGIGGGFSTLTVTLALPRGAVVEGANTLRFRFNKSDGVASGFRIVAFNLLTADSGKALEASAFTHDDPDTWAPPLTDPDSIRAGEALWLNAPLRANRLPNAPPIRAHCADCHTRDGRDLKLRVLQRFDCRQVPLSRSVGCPGAPDRQLRPFSASSESGPAMESSVSTGTRPEFAAGRELVGRSRLVVGARR